MSLQFPCPNCQAILNAPEQFSGRKAKCKKCGAAVRIPGEKQSEKESTAIPPPSPASPVVEGSSTRPAARGASEVGRTTTTEPSVAEERRKEPQQVEQTSLSSHPISKQAILDAIHAPIEPVPSTLAYKVALLAVATVMLLLPLLYFGLILGMGWGTWLYAQYGFETLKNNPPQGRKGGGAVLIYVAPLFASLVAIIFMVKPIFARPSKGSKPVSLDPNEEPLLFAYVEKLCKSVHAPVPRRIDIDSNVNASASLRRGWLSLLRSNDLVLTIGMPLASGLSLREFSGVLAHEFGHFSQGLGMRLTYVVRSINFWFARVVYERDVWDQRLASWASGIDFRIGIVLHFARLMVWLTRRVLWVFMMIGYAISSFLMRQMEYDADLHEIRLSGSKAFSSTSRQLRRLGVAHQQVLSELEEFMLNGKLVDDLPRFVEIRRDSHDEKILNLLSQMESEEKGHWYDTHPADRQRIAVAEKLKIAGNIKLDAPARALFNKYEQHCKNVTRAFYQEACGEKFHERMLSDVEQLLSFQEASKEASQASERFFGLNFKLPRMVIPLPVASRGLSQEEAFRKLETSRQAMIAGLPQYDQNSKAFEELDSRWIEAKQALSILRAGFKLDKQAWKNFEGHTSEAIGNTEQAIRARLGSLHGKLAPFEQHFQNRVDAAIQWLHATPETSLPNKVKDSLGAAEKITGCLNVQNQTYRSVVDLRGEISSLVALLGLIAGKDATKEQINEFEGSCGRVLNSIKNIRAQSVGVLYPFEHSEGEIDLAHYLASDMPKDEDKPAILEAASQCLQHFHYAYFRNIGELAVIVEQVETALGLPLQNTPEPVADSEEIITALEVTQSSTSTLPVDSHADGIILASLSPTTIETATTATQDNLSESVNAAAAHDFYPPPVMTSTNAAKKKRSYVPLLILLGTLGVLLPMVLFGIALIVRFPALLSKWEGRRVSPVPSQASIPASSGGTMRTPAGAGTADRNHSIRRQVQYRIPSDSPLEYQVKVSDAKEIGKNYLEGTCSIRNLNRLETHPEGTATGTGFAISSDGLFATCAHVVSGATQIQVIANNQRAIATVVAIDWEKDLAILKTDSLKLKPLQLSKLKEIALAQDIIVVGFPLTEELGMGVKVTTGTVSGMVSKGARGELISVDASINPGNSGGPVINQQGEVIGVASMKLSNSGSVDSVGFASPVKQLSDLIEYQKLTLSGAKATATKTVRSRPEIAAEVTPSVVLIRAQGKAAGNTERITFRNNYKQMAGLFGSAQNLDTTETLRVTPFGQVQSLERSGFLPFALGNLPELIFQPLDSTLQDEWNFKRSTALQRQQPNVNGGRAFQRMGPTSPKRDVAESIPAMEEISFKLNKEENGRLYFDRKVTFQTLDDESNPTLKMEGTGTWVFDLKDGLSQSLDQTVKVTEKGSNTYSIRVQYDRRSKEEMEEQKRQNDAALAAKQEQERIEREVPNPEAVKNLLADLKKAGFQGASWAILKKLSSLAIVEEFRQEAIALLRQYAFPEKKNSFMGDSVPNSIEAFVHWADESCEAEILGLVKKNSAKHDLKSILGYVGRLKKLEHAPMLITYLQDPFISSDAAAAILNYDDPSIEDILLEQWAKSSRTNELRAIIKLLGDKFGTEKSIVPLEKMGKEDPVVRMQGPDAVRKIKARR